MPSKSQAQHNLMAAVANDPKFAAKAGISQKVGKEFMAADKNKDEKPKDKKKSRMQKMYPSMDEQTAPDVEDQDDQGDGS